MFLLFCFHCGGSDGSEEQVIEDETAIQIEEIRTEIETANQKLDCIAPLLHTPKEISEECKKIITLKK